jgi:DNA-directed RNA polymerase subunit RPC12/RpoP
MSLRCSLTGHDWGEKNVDTRREETDGQVAVTEREYRVCERCGERRLVSENTEVRATDEGDEENEKGEVSTFAPSEEYESDETEDAAIIDDDGDDLQWEEENDDEVRDRVREATGTEVTRTETPESGDDFVCPDCGFSSSDESLRPGDICPECGGYLEER